MKDCLDEKDIEMGKWEESGVPLRFICILVLVDTGIPEMAMGWVSPWDGLGQKFRQLCWVGLGWVPNGTPLPQC